jgi:predicted N-acetyltransferase YhbS
MAQAHGFFSALGLVADWHAYDLQWTSPGEGGAGDPARAAATSWDESVYRPISASEVADLRHLLCYFGRRWQEDTERRCQRLREGRSEEIMGAFQEGRLVGFCHIWSARSQTLGPSTFWLDRGDDLWGGVGPLGVHPEQRGLGLGAGVVESSMAYLRRAGALRIGVDWTGLPKFYERCGFRPWLSYRGYHDG